MHRFRTGSPNCGSVPANKSDDSLCNELYLAIVADVIIEEPAISHRNLRIIGCFQSLLEANKAVNHHCIYSSRNECLRETENAIPTLTFNESGGFVDIRQQFKDFDGNLLHSQHFWVQHFSIGGLGGNGNVPAPLYVVIRSLFLDGDDGEGMEDEDEETFHEEIVSVHRSLEDADKCASTCCLRFYSAQSDSLDGEGMEIEDDVFANEEGTWMAWVQVLDVQF